MSGLAIYFPTTPASKRMPYSPSPCEWPSKRRRMTPTADEAHSLTKSNLRTIYLQSNSSINGVSPPSSTEFVTPPDSCDLHCSPSPAQTRWAAAIGSSLLASDSQDTVFPISALDLVTTIMSFPNPPLYGDTPSPDIDSSPSLRASSDMCTPAKAPAPSTCLDTFGKRLDVEHLQLSQEPSPVAESSTISRMLVPRSTWRFFRTYSSAHVDPRGRVVAHGGKDGRRRAVTVENEDLWMDEKNPFLLTPLDLRQTKDTDCISGTIIPATSSLNLLSDWTSTIR